MPWESMDPQAFDHLCRLARLAPPIEERQTLRGQMRAILAYVDRLRELDVAAAAPLAPGDVPVARAREDRPRPSLAPSEALAQAPARAWDFFTVPQMMED